MQDVCYQSYHFHVLSFNNTLRLLVIPLNDGELNNSIRSGTTRRERKSNIPMNFNCNGETLAMFIGRQLSSAPAPFTVGPPTRQLTFNPLHSQTVFHKFLDRRCMIMGFL